MLDIDWVGFVTKAWFLFMFTLVGLLLLSELHDVMRERKRNKEERK